MTNEVATDTSDDRPDRGRWLRFDWSDEIWLVDGNPHTHLGRMRALEPSTGSTTAFSRSEVTEASESTWAWIDGFLAGNEPEPDHMFGVGIYDGDLDADQRWDRWRTATAAFRDTGTWPYEAWAHLIPLPADADLPVRVWASRGDEICEWANGEWRFAALQPAGGFNDERAAPCADFRSHQLTLRTSVHAICERCGHTTQGLPHDMSNEDFQRVQFTLVAELDAPSDSGRD